MAKVKKDTRKKVASNQSLAHSLIIGDNPEEMNDSFISELAERLIKNQACVMVGAGFSKNANRLGSKTSIPSWIELGEPFYRKLHNDKSTPYKITTSSEIQELAAKIEKQYERKVLIEGTTHNEVVENI